MDQKVFIYLFISFLNFGCYESADVPVKDTVALILEEEELYKTNLASCKLTTGDLKGLSISGPKGEKGDTGDNGTPGLDGPVGPPGYQGPQGMPGDKGEPGRNGDKGQPGLQGKRGVDGEPGAPGDDGKPGQKGEPGSIGLSGMPGLDGTCTQVCHEYVPEAPPPDPGEGKSRDPGTRYNALRGLCNIKYSDEVNETVWVNPDNPFQVRCNMTSHMTCLITKPKKSFSALYVNAIEPFWLSERNYNLTEFYGIPMHHISWLQQRATQVRQIIRYHCMNSYVNDQPETALYLYGWNDLAIGPFSNPNSPLTYTTLRYADNCKSDAPKNEWRYSDILITSKIPKRLPVIDFRINDIRSEEKQSFYLELVELCFG